MELFRADLTVPGSFDAAVSGAHAVVHAAAAVMLTARDPQREIIDVTVNGSRNVLDACRRALDAGGPLSRFILVSSIAAIQDNQRPAGHVYTEADSNESATLARDPYSLSKYLCERAVDEYFAALPADLQARFTSAYVNPGAIYGPVLSPAHVRSSPTIMVDLLTGKIPMCPQLGFPSIDVRDVADTAIAFLEQPQAHGRHICVAGTYTIKQLSAFAASSFPQYRLPHRLLPNFFMYLGAIFDKRLTFAFLRENLGRYRQFDNSKLRRDIGWTPRDMGATVRDTCQSLIDLGCVPRVE